MAVPRNRSSNRRKNMRRSHHAKEARFVLVCECGAPRLPHCLCGKCGKYTNGKNQTLVVIAKAE